MKKKKSRIGMLLLLAVCIISLTFLTIFGIDTLVRNTTSKGIFTTFMIHNPQQPQQEDTEALLPLTKDAGREYIDSTLFLGDSNTVRFMKYNDGDDLPFTTTNNTIAVVGMGVQAIDTLNCEQLSTGTYTMVEAVSILQPRRIIITFGTNNLDGQTEDPTSFISTYQTQLLRLQEAYPSVDIIVNTIPPIGSHCAYSKLHKEQISLYNNAIQEMCQENGWKFLNSYEALADVDDGYARVSYTIDDGVHLSQTGLMALFQYIRTHAYITEDDRPQPLSEIPDIIGPLTNIYDTNPLSN